MAILDGLMSDDLMCLRCRKRFTPICPQQRCCDVGCADMAGRDWESTYVRAELDRMLAEAWKIQKRNENDT